MLAACFEADPIWSLYGRELQQPLCIASCLYVLCAENVLCTNVYLRWTDQRLYVCVALYMPNIIRLIIFYLPLSGQFPNRKTCVCVCVLFSSSTFKYKLYMNNMMMGDICYVLYG